MENMSVFQRLLWSCIYISLISCTIFMVVTLWNGFSVHPTVTTLVSSTYPVNKVPFPGVAICSINKISKKRARNVAFRIANNTGRNPEEIMTFIRFIGQLYDFEFEAASVPQLLEFQSILDMLEMSVIEVARNIVDPCEELLRDCFWRNVEVSCVSVFSMRLTHHGYCCVFNYVKITEESSETGKKPITTDAGIENGLHVAVKSDPSDNYYTTLSSPGILIYIFVPSDYPDKTSGGVTEILTQPDSENFIEIVPTTLMSVPDVANYPVEKRGCLFDHERSTDNFHGIYSQSDCNVACRVMSIQAICECIPFMIPFSDESTACTLADLPCLNKYKYKWSSFFPDDVGPYLLKEKQDSLRCDQPCYSACGGTVYEAFANSFPILNNTENEESITHVYLYYLNRFSNLYRQDVVFYWFEILSNFGGIFGIFLGWSLIFMIQIFFFYFKKVAEKLVLI